MRAMEDRGLKINRNKTVYLRFNVDGNLDGNSGTEFGTSESYYKLERHFFRHGRRTTPKCCTHVRIEARLALT